MVAPGHSLVPTTRPCVRTAGWAGSWPQPWKPVAHVRNAWRHQWSTWPNRQKGRRSWRYLEDGKGMQKLRRQKKRCLFWFICLSFKLGNVYPCISFFVGNFFLHIHMRLDVHWWVIGIPNHWTSKLRLAEGQPKHCALRWTQRRDSDSAAYGLGPRVVWGPAHGSPPAVRGTWPQWLPCVPKLCVCESSLEGRQIWGSIWSTGWSFWVGVEAGWINLK